MKTNNTVLKNDAEILSYLHSIHSKKLGFLFKSLKSCQWVARWLKVLAAHAWQPHFNPWDPQKGGRREPPPEHCPLTSVWTSWHTRTGFHTRKVTTFKNFKWQWYLYFINRSLDTGNDTVVKTVVFSTGGYVVLICSSLKHGYLVADLFYFEVVERWFKEKEVWHNLLCFHPICGALINAQPFWFL